MINQQAYQAEARLVNQIDHQNRVLSNKIDSDTSKWISTNQNSLSDTGALLK
jgi:hypothetical protein